MIIRKNLTRFYNGCDLTLLLSYQAGGISRGKYLFGIHSLERELYVIAYDDSCEFHKHIAAKYNLDPLGGGSLVINDGEKTVHISESSQAYGREPDRQLTLRAIEQAFPQHSCTADE